MPEQVFNPSGLCMCGCGKSTNLATRTRPERGETKGQHYRYLSGHGRRQDLWKVEDRSYTTPCLIWQGNKVKGGYGRINVGGTMFLVHIYVYLLNVGPIPAGLDLDHLCRQRDCGQWDHLEAVTRQVNVQRSATRHVPLESVPTIQSSKEAVTVLAKRYEVAPATIRRIQRGITFNNIHP